MGLSSYGIHQKNTEDDIGDLTESLKARQVVLGQPCHVIASRPRRILKNSLDVR